MYVGHGSKLFSNKISSYVVSISSLGVPVPAPAPAPAFQTIYSTTKLSRPGSQLNRFNSHVWSFIEIIGPKSRDPSPFLQYNLE